MQHTVTEKAVINFIDFTHQELSEILLDHVRQNYPDIKLPSRYNIRVKFDLGRDNKGAATITWKGGQDE